MLEIEHSRSTPKGSQTLPGYLGASWLSDDSTPQLSAAPEQDGDGEWDSSNAINLREAPAFNGPQDSSVPNGVDRKMSYMHGPRFYLVNLLLGLNFFMVTMELTVVATAIVSISDDIGGFESSSWVMTSYLLGYVALIIVFSKLSDMLGRKPVLIFCIATFTVFSGACGAAQSMVQLIILRAFQGVGGGGCFAMNMVCMTEVVPPEKYGPYGSVMGLFPVISMGIGPVIGGAIVSSANWRWVFLMNLPTGFVALALAILAVPSGFPYHGHLEKVRKKGTLSSLKDAFRSLDILGSVLLCFGSIAFAAGFSEAGSRFDWKSAYVISLTAGSGLLWIALLIWERWISSGDTFRSPVLPWQLLTNRVVCGMLLSSFFLGGPTTATLFVLPSRFQLVNGLSGFDAGVRLLPFALGTGCGAVIGSIMTGRVKIPTIYVAFLGAVLQIVGLAFLGVLPSTSEIPPRIFGLQVVAGLGCGITYQCFYITLPIVTARHHTAIGVGAVTQSRMMGGALFLAIATSVFNGHVLPALERVGLESADELVASHSLSDSPALQQTLEELRIVLSEGYNRQILVFCASAGVQAFAILLLWRRPQIRLP